MGLTRTPQLAAVNTMLSVIGEAPVNTLDATSQTADVAMAKSLLEEVSREVQSNGWHFNREYDVSLASDASDNIVIPTNAARVDVEPSNAGGTDYIQRGSKLYNKSDSTYIINDAKKCTIIYLLDWDDLPESARQYVMIRAARKFQDRVVGSEKHHSFTTMDEMHSLIALRSAEADNADFTIFDNYDVYRVIDRGSVINKVTS
jgi:hypothetical protein